ncbi:MAG: response regulator transcription factor [Acidimicrobiales bacterium]
MLGKPEKTIRYANRVSQLDNYFQSNQPDDPILTKREQEVLQLFANGKSTVEVARALTISQKTVKNHLTSIYQKLNVRDRTEAVLLAVRMGIIKLERRTRPRL